MPIGAEYATRMVIATVSGAGPALSARIIPNVGSPIAMTLAVSQGTTSSTSSIWYAIVPTGTLATVEITYTFNPYDGSNIAVYSVDAASLNSQTPVDAKTAVGTATNRSVSLTTVSGGFVIAVACMRNISANSATWVGVNERYDLTAAGQVMTGGEMSGTPDATAAYTVTATYVNSAGMNLSAVSWR
jgi:hypothetical protein